MSAALDSIREVTVGERPPLAANLGVPGDAAGLVIFAHGSGSGRFSPRNAYVAARLRENAFATLLLDLLTPEEEQSRANVFDIGLLAARLIVAADWAARQPELAALPLGYFGASTGAGAALRAAAVLGERVSAVVSRGGRPDLAGAEALRRVRTPTLLIVGSRDESVIGLNDAALQQLTCPAELAIVPGASHLFEEPGTLAQVVALANAWFARHLAGERQ